MKKTFCILFLLFFTCDFFSQGEIVDTIKDADSIKIPHNTAYIELGGNSGLYSLNYERIFVNTPAFKFFSRIGAGPLPNGKHFSQIYLAEENFCFGKNGRYLEAGIGLTFQRKWVEDCDENKTFAYGNLYYGIFRLGVRFQPENKGTVFRIGLTPTMYYKDQCSNGFSFQFFGGISYGLVF
ncbi:MAG: hypothetical protein IAF38_09755 [Bacteroidia bacterium]|nr:hypothetical protein [Bacteroidia bacterium]